MDEALGIKVDHECLPTLVDGKVKIVCTESGSYNNCYICGANPPLMSNRYGYNAITGREHTLKYGFSPLHQTINAFKWLNKAGQYRDVKNWQARGDENQASVKEWTRKMSVMYKKRLGLTLSLIHI